MPTVIGLSGSLRQGSYNSALLRLAVALAPAGCDIEIASIREIPLFDGDVEAQGLPAPVVALKDKISAAYGMLLATPAITGGLTVVSTVKLNGDDATLTLPARLVEVAVKR